MDVLAERFSWCLSRRLKYRETPELFMMFVGGSDTHSESMATASTRKSTQRGRHRARVARQVGANEPQDGGVIGEVG
jgi:hypothetical protein